MGNGPPAQSHVDAQPLLTPLSAHALAAEEVTRRNEEERLGSFKCGCTEVDERLLLGGFSNGSIVGISSDDETEVGLLVSPRRGSICPWAYQYPSHVQLQHTLSYFNYITNNFIQLGIQTLVRSILNNKTQRATLVAPSLSAAGVVRLLSAVTISQLASTQEACGDIKTAEDCLRRVMVSRVFDIDGIWQLFAELDEKGRSTSVKSPPRTHTEVKDATQEIQDSEDEDFSLPDKSKGKEKDYAQASDASGAGGDRSSEQLASPIPDFILICGFSSLLTSPFAQRQRDAAHSSLGLFSAQLRFSARSLPSRPLIMILNSTTSEQEAGPSSVYASNEHSLVSENRTKQYRSLDPTLNSIFNSPPTSMAYGRGLRQSKPKFGLIFSQLLDVHLLCSRLPRAKEDAESALTETHLNSHISGLRQDTIIEVLLDSIGKWQPGHGRRHREQLWVAVDSSHGIIKNRS